MGILMLTKNSLLVNVNIIIYSYKFIDNVRSNNKL